MKSIGLFVYGLLFCYALQAQTLQPATINSTGSSSENSNAQLTFSLGGVVAGSSSNSEAILSQGFSNPLEVVSLEENKELNINARVFPVPATNTLTIDLPVSKHAYQAILYNSMGSPVLNREMYSGENLLELDDIAPGQYILKLETSSGELIKSFNITKL